MGEPGSAPHSSKHSPTPTLLNISSAGKAEGEHYLYKLDVEFPCEGGHLPLDTQLSLSDAHRDDFIMSCAVPNTIKDVQVLHHDMAIQSHIKYLPRLKKKKKERQCQNHQLHIPLAAGHHVPAWASSSEIIFKMKELDIVKGTEFFT